MRRLQLGVLNYKSGVLLCKVLTDKATGRGGKERDEGPRMQRNETHVPTVLAPEDTYSVRA
jgi:hypothetical protein